MNPVSLDEFLYGYTNPFIKSDTTNDSLITPVDFSSFSTIHSLHSSTVDSSTTIDVEAVSTNKPKGGKKRPEIPTEVQSDSEDTLVDDDSKSCKKQKKSDQPLSPSQHESGIAGLRAKSEERAKSEPQFGLTVKKIRDFYSEFESRKTQRYGNMSVTDFKNMISETRRLFIKNKVHFEGTGKTKEGVEYQFTEIISHFISGQKKYIEQTKFLNFKDPHRKVMFFATDFSEAFLKYASSIPKLQTIAKAIKKATIVASVDSPSSSSSESLLSSIETITPSSSSSSSSLHSSTTNTSTEIDVEKRRETSTEVQSDPEDSVSDVEDDTPSYKTTRKQKKNDPRKSINHYSLDMTKLSARSDERAKKELQFGVTVKKLREIYKVFERRMPRTFDMSVTEFGKMISDTKKLFRKNKVFCEVEGKRKGVLFKFSESIAHFISRHKRYNDEAKFLNLNPTRKVMFFATGFSEAFFKYASSIPELKDVVIAIKKAKVIANSIS